VVERAAVRPRWSFLASRRPVMSPERLSRWMAELTVRISTSAFSDL
jgi:hypothetical protein